MCLGGYIRKNVINGSVYLYNIYYLEGSAIDCFKTKYFTTPLAILQFSSAQSFIYPQIIRSTRPQIKIRVFINLEHLGIGGVYKI